MKNVCKQSVHFKVETVFQDIFVTLKAEKKKQNLQNEQNENQKQAKLPGCLNTLVCLRFKGSQFVG